MTIVVVGVVVAVVHHRAAFQVAVVAAQVAYLTITHVRLPIPAHLPEEVSDGFLYC